MPKISVRKASEVPAPVRTAKAMLEQQKLYEDFVAQARGDVGELTLDAAESVRGVKVRLTRAATRTGSKLQVWDVDGKVYFQVEEPVAKRGRPRKTA